MISKAVIIPTGNEICEGIVIDSDSPAIMQLILENYPQCQVTRAKPTIDKEAEIADVITYSIMDKNDLVIIIGGSGGGHRYVSTLGEDYTHCAMLNCLSDYSVREIWGKNGHLWSKLIVGRKENTLIINVPGPYVEAIAAVKACMACIKDSESDLNSICKSIAKAVLSNYPTGGEIK